MSHVAALNSDYVLPCIAKWQYLFNLEVKVYTDSGLCSGLYLLTMDLLLNKAFKQ